MAQLIAFDKNHELHYEGYCKLSINQLSLMLVIEPKSEGCKMISALFKWNFVLQKNLLFVFAENNFMNFFLVFKNEKISLKVYQSINSQSVKTNCNTDQISIENEFLVPIFKKINNNPPCQNQELTKIMANWIMELDVETNQKYSILMKDYNVFDLIAKTNQEISEKDAKSLKTQKNLKRKFLERTKDNNNSKIASKVPQIDTTEFTTVIQIPNFKLMTYLIRPRKLLIYTGSSTFHEYQWHSKKGIFVCTKPQCHNSAFIDHDVERGEICVKMPGNRHGCKTDTQLPQNYVEIKMIKKSEYEILENCIGKTQKMLFIFGDSEGSSRREGYEYYWKASECKFFCRGCKILGNNKIRANICYEGTEKEYCELINTNHVCQKKRYKLEKYHPFYDVVLKPQFEIQKFVKDGKERQRLQIYGSNRQNCYSYYFCQINKQFFCNGCSVMKHRVAAQLRQNFEGDDYVVMSDVKHICQIQQAKTILRPPKIEFLENTKSGSTPKLFIFVGEKNAKDCYIFTPHNSTSQCKNYVCMGCRSILTSKKSTTTPQKAVTGSLVKEGNGKYAFEMTPNQTHKCKPKKFEISQFQSFKTFDFIYFRSKSDKKQLKLAILHPDDKTLCYTLYHRKYDGKFACDKCKIKRNRLAFKIQKDENGKEYFEHDHSRHQCKQIKVATISAQKFILLKESGLKVTASNSRTPKINESRKIIKLPNYELCPNSDGEPGQTLLIFLLSDRSRFYKYEFRSYQKLFACKACRSLKQFVTAKLLTDDSKNNGEQFVLLNNFEHLCSPLEAAKQENQIVSAPNLRVFTHVDSSKFVIFTSESQEYCYEYSFFIHFNVFLCLGCNLKRKNAVAKLCKNELGEDCVELMHAEHVCLPRKFQPFKFQRIPASMFELSKNAIGEMDKEVRVFASETKDDLGYILNWRSRGFFQCVNCENLKKYVTVKLKTDKSGELYLQPCCNQHVCNQIKLNVVPKK